MSKKNKYSESVKKLREFLLEKEDLRKSWAKEKWSHADGNLFKIGKVLVPILSVIGLGLMFVVCLIRFANIPEINKILTNGIGSNPYMKNDPLIYPFFALVLVALCLCIYVAIRFIVGKVKKTPFILFFNSLFLTLCALLRLSADQGTFPDNSDFELGPTFTYYEHVTAALVVFGILTLYALILVILNIRDNKEFNETVDYTLLKIVENENKSQDLLTEDEYAKLIDEYIEKHSK